MEFRVLGPLEAGVAGDPLALGGPKQRAILALLVLNANEVVPRDRLIADVWGDDPPAEVEATLRVYVARLRKLIAAGKGAPATLEALRNGYVLRVAPDAVDLNRFQALVTAGEEALASGRPNDAAEHLARALALWRGPALVDVADEDGVAREAQRLEELRLRALELRNDAQLAVGRHADVVSELETLVAAEPYRERFAAQLMLALYRCGRQTEALSVYGRLRARLHDEFGLEPTPPVRELERRVLAQDPVLSAPTRIGRATPAERPRRRPALAAAAVAVSLVLVGGISASAGGPAVASAEPVVLRGDSVVAIDEETGDVLGETMIGGRPIGVATGLGGIWVVNVDDETLLRIHPESRRVVETVGLGVVPCGLAVGGGSVWVLSCDSRQVLEVDPAVNDVVATIDLPRALFGGYWIVFGRGAVWVRTGTLPGELLRIDAGTHAMSVVRRDLRSVASDGRAIWAIVGTYTYRLQRLEPPGEATRLDNLGGSDPGQTFVTAGAGSVWVTSAGGSLWKVEPRTSRVVASVSLGRRISGVAVTRRDVWVVTGDGHAVRVDGAGGRVVSTVRLGVYATQGPAIAVGEGAVWLSAVP